MSHTETHIGKIRKLNLEGKTPEEFALDFLKDFRDPTYCETALEQLLSDYSEQYIHSNGQLFEIFDHFQYDDSTDIYELHKHTDNVYTFVMQFYNGGTCLSECLEEKLNDIYKRELFVKQMMNNLKNN